MKMKKKITLVVSIWVIMYVNLFISEFLNVPHF